MTAKTNSEFIESTERQIEQSNRRTVILFGIEFSSETEATLSKNYFIEKYPASSFTRLKCGLYEIIINW